MFSLFSDEQKKHANKASNDDDTPTTSNHAQRSPYKFKKFRDDLHGQPKKKHHHKRREHKRKTLHQKPSSQIATQRLLRSSKRRQLEAKATTSRQTDLKRRLNFLNNSTKKLPTQQKDPNASLEDGELVSEVENDEKDKDDKKDNNEIANQTKNATTGDEDDCICIEQPIEQITIDDDDTPSTSHLNSTVIATATPVCQTIVELKESQSELAKSPLRTPSSKVKALSASAPVSPSYAEVAATASVKRNNSQKLMTSTPCGQSKSIQIDNEPLPFFVDISSAAWFETINSEDTFSNYTRGCSTMREHTVKKRRSGRLEKRNHSDSDVIVLDDTLAELTVVPFPPKTSFTIKSRKRRSNELDDDSCVFVSESNPNKLPTYIPLDGGDDVPNPIKEVRNPFVPKRYKPINPLFTLSEHKQMKKYNDNAYDPTADEVPKKQSPKRMVIVDGSNVAYSHALNKEFSVKGLKICLEYFEKMGHDVKAVVPQFRLQRAKSTEPEELERLHRAGKIVFTPCKNLPGNSSTSYDDRFILQLAGELDAAVVSNDNYRDLMHENKAMKKLVENRVIGYVWCNDLFMLPKDPYGRFGPTLYTILNRE